CASKEYDLLVRGGTVFDGSGGPGAPADVAVKDGRIVRIGAGIEENKARDVIDANGLAVAPGFIDPHTHTDVQLLANPRAESKIRQGVTTEIGGNCGYSYFPLSDLTFEEERKSVDREFGVTVDWRDISGFFGRLEQSRVALNYATFLGQGSLRGAVLGPYDRPPKPEELDRMKQFIRENMDAGALGLSTGLQYTPGCFADTAELIELCREVAALGGIYATHMRSEEDQVIEAVEETLKIARETKVALQIAHLKANYPRNWSKIDQIIALLEEAAKEGVPVTADRYPYIASATGLSSFFPEWAREGTSADFVKRLSDSSLDKKLREHTAEEEKKLGSWDKVLLSSILSEKNRPLEGKTVLASATEQGKAPFEFMRDLLVEEGGAVGMVQFGMSEDNLKRFYAHPLVTVGSDGNSAATYGVLSKGKPHPRFYGTFPRYLGKYVREEKVLPLEEAIRKITSFTAEKFGLTERGRIREGYHADLAVFDPGRIIDKATFENPHQYPEGIPHVIVNGVPAVRDGEHTGALAGKILRKGKAKG
ncbi:MAG: N-acyl-D-amino-acid deacylase family protein, partial [Candidatus Latescibacterota bacterium]